jgi:hypothetical protein
LNRNYQVADPIPVMNAAPRGEGVDPIDLPDFAEVYRPLLDSIVPPSNRSVKRRRESSLGRISSTRTSQGAAGRMLRPVASEPVREILRHLWVCHTPARREGF